MERASSFLKLTESPPLREAEGTQPTEVVAADSHSEKVCQGGMYPTGIAPWVRPAPNVESGTVWGVSMGENCQCGKMPDRRQQLLQLHPGQNCGSSSSLWFLRLLREAGPNLESSIVR